MIKTFTLLWINWQRVKRGHRPLLHIRDGRRGAPVSCPIARSLCSNQSVCVSATYWSDSNGRTRDLPKFVRRFIEEFDTGKIGVR